MHSRGWTAQKAIEHMQKVRPIVRPNAFFTVQLHNYVPVRVPVLKEEVPAVVEIPQEAPLEGTVIEMRTEEQAEAEGVPKEVAAAPPVKPPTPEQQEVAAVTQKVPETAEERAENKT